jgi:predicted phage terminase large subunit-like protein
MLEDTNQIVRTRDPLTERIREAAKQPIEVIRELNKRHLYYFIEYFWPLVSPHTFHGNWHIKYLCEELEKVAYRVANKLPKEYDLVINVPPGTTKTITCSIMFPVWCWTRWPWMKFITASYSGALSLESADYSRELIRSQEFREVYPSIEIKEDKDTKSNFKIVEKIAESAGRRSAYKPGGNRFSTSVGGTLTGYHGDILIVDDPIKPDEAASDLQLGTANRWIEQTLSTRKTDKANTPTILIMQRLHQNDPAGHMLDKQKKNLKHICIPGEIRNYRDKVKPPELIEKYVDDLMDPVRIPWSVLHDMEKDLGQYGYAGQVGQDPTPPGGGMFKVGRFLMVNSLPHHKEILHTVRYWDKAASDGTGTFTVGVRMSQLTGNRWLVEDVKRGQWATHEREKVIKDTAIADGVGVDIWVEQEPGSGGKESAEGTIRNLAGFVCKAHKPTGTEGDKARRADTYSVQVNNGSVLILNNIVWNWDFIEEHRFFPFGTYKDQVDASAGAFNKLVGKKVARSIKR